MYTPHQNIPYYFGILHNNRASGFRVPEPRTGFGCGTLFFSMADTSVLKISLTAYCFHSDCTKMPDPIYNILGTRKLTIVTTGSNFQPAQSSKWAC